MDLSKLSLDELEHEYKAVMTFVEYKAVMTFVENNEGHNYISSQDFERIAAELFKRLRMVYASQEVDCWLK
jgi:hypothetical protein